MQSQKSAERIITLNKISLKFQVDTLQNDMK